MKAKLGLAKVDKYKDVYIENDLPAEVRIIPGNMRTMQKLTGKDKEYGMKGLRLIKKQT
jgi:hypothetical protein